MRFYTERCEAMRNFANKIWNASRFLMMNLTIDRCELPGRLELEDKWILSKLNSVIPEVTENMERYELGVAAQKVYDFIWDSYCDWYIELTKTRLQGEDEDSKLRAQQVLCYVLTETLKLLHPFMPFITEEIWQALPHSGDYLMLQQWPQHRAELDFPEEEKAMELIMDAIRGVRARRAEMNVPPSKKAQLTVSTLERAVFEQGIPFLKRLAYASDVTVEGVADAGSDDAMTAQGMVTVTTHAARLFMPWPSWWIWRRRRPALRRSSRRTGPSWTSWRPSWATPALSTRPPPTWWRPSRTGLKSSGPSWPNWRNPPLPWRKQDKKRRNAAALFGRRHFPRVFVAFCNTSVVVE